jgi:hypothetical protein
MVYETRNSEMWKGLMSFSNTETRLLVPFSFTFPGMREDNGCKYYSDRHSI